MIEINELKLGDAIVIHFNKYDAKGVVTDLSIYGKPGTPLSDQRQGWMKVLFNKDSIRDTFPDMGCEIYQHWIDENPDKYERYVPFKSTVRQEEQEQSSRPLAIIKDRCYLCIRDVHLGDYDNDYLAFEKGHVYIGKQLLEEFHGDSKIEGYLYCFEDTDKKIEPEYKIGDYVVYLSSTYLIKDVTDINYVFENVTLFSINDQYKLRLWKPSDIKAGDIVTLTQFDQTYIVYVDEVHPDLYVACGYMSCNGNYFTNEKQVFCNCYINDICPATMEQKEALISNIQKYSR